MRKLKLLIASCALLLGVGNASAYTVDDLTSAGWTQVTDATITGVADNYYMLVDANSSAYVMSAEADHYRPCYKTINNPVENPSFVWILESSGDKFNLKSASTGAYFKQASGWNTSVGDGKNGSTASLEFTTLPEGKYSIQCVGQGLVGHWNDNGAAVASDGENIAANKAAKDAPGFYLYSISKATYNAALVAARATGVSSATKASPVDVTSYIQNADWSGDWGAWEFTCTSSGNIQWGQKTLESWTANNVVVKQVLTGVPNGLYKVSADVISGNNDNKVAYVYAVGDTKVSSSAVSAVASAGNYTTMSNEVAGNTLTADNVSVTGNSLTVGIDQSAGWIVADNFKLYYYGPTVAGNAIALPDGGAMAAGQWYFFDVETAADNYTATATTLGDIIYTTAGSTLIEDESGITANFTEENNSLSATRYYVKSSSTQSLAIAPASYSYSISEASANVSYIQAGNTVTVSYTTSSNDPDATLTQDYSGVTFGGSAITATPTASGFTFTVPTVTANTDYTLSIPAGAIKYNEENTNAAQDITLKTPAVLDGVYYMYNTDTKNYLSRGGNYGTQAILDNNGMAVIVKTDANNATTVQYFDIERFLGDDGFCYADCSGGRIRKYNISSVDGGYKFLNTNNSKYLAVFENQAVGDAVEGDNLVGTSNVWSLESTTSHVANYTANADAQVAAATAKITALNSITTKTALQAELANNYGEAKITITGAKAEKFQVYATNEKPSEEATYYSETVSGLTPGLYKLSVDAFQRAGQNANVAAANGARGLIYLYAGTAKTQLKSVMDASAASAYDNDFEVNGKHYPNNQASAYTALENCDYSNDVYVYVAADENSETGSLEIGIKNPNYPGANNGCWAVYNNWTLTYYGAKATSAEKTALADAISDAEDKKLGFEKDEYAPYNNVAALEALTAAKAVAPETASGAAVVFATNALKSATWTANAASMNAIYDGDFSEETEDTSSPLDVTPKGWTASKNFRVLIKNSTDYPGLTDASASSAIMSWSSGVTYGEELGYEMPLAAHTIYQLSFKAAGWNNESRSDITVSVLNSSDGMAAQSLGTPDRDIKGSETNTAGMTSYSVLFVTGKAGNYVFNIKSNNNFVFTDLELLKKGENYITFTDGAVPSYAPGTYPSVKITRTLAADRWYTAVYPFSIPVDGTKIDQIATLESFDAKEGTLNFSSANASTANVPFLFHANEDNSAFSLATTNVEVSAASATPAIAGQASLIGTYGEQTLTANEEYKYYVLSSNTIYPVGAADATIPAYRAYIQIAQGSAARSLKFVIDGEETTGIDGIAAESVSRGEVYNLNGQRVASPRKGLYIQNGKKVLVK